MHACVLFPSIKLKHLELQPHSRKPPLPMMLFAMSRTLTRFGRTSFLKTTVYSAVVLYAGGFKWAFR